MRKLIAGGLTAALGTLLFATSALASSHNPTGEFAKFAECPLDRATINDCVYSVTDGGYFTLGKKTVPIKNTTILQGGFEGEEDGIEFYGAENGDTLSKTAQPVPGGLIGVTAPKWWPLFLQNWFNGIIEEGLTGVDATAELTGPTKGLTNIDLNSENLLFREGTAVGLPLKFHLENPTLGPSCYIGANTPVQIDLTTGSDGELEGKSGDLSANPAFNIFTLKGTELVNNSFTAPAATGCGGLFALFVNPLVNELVGLPAGEGENAALLKGEFSNGVAEWVRDSE
jgi:hypothetical protein